MKYRSAAPLGTWQGPLGDDLPAVDGTGGAPAQMPASGTAGSGPDPGGTGGVKSTGSGGMRMAESGPSIGGRGASGSAGISSGGGGGTSGSGGTQGGAIGVFAFDAVTVDQGGKYAPRNVGAIWIETSSGQFVKTLKVWARTRGRYLTRFNQEAGGNRVDAVTAATLRPFMSHHVTWDLTDVNGSAVANASYKVVIEVTDHDGTGKSAEVAFDITGDPATLMPPDQQYFTDMKIALE